MRSNNDLQPNLTSYLSPQLKFKDGKTDGRKGKESRVIMELHGT